jgi:hypothetical protein
VRTNPILLLSVALLTAACSDLDRRAPAVCEGKLFGLPGPANGLEEGQCGATCECGGETHRAPTFEAAEIDRLAGTTLLEPPPVPEVDPYGAGPLASPTGDWICAVVPEPGGGGAYRVRSVPAGSAGTALVTHFGPCGLCSSLQDLSVYMRHPDLTEPVRACGLLALTATEADAQACIEDLGFTPPCARIWFYNSRNTRRECLAECLLALDAPYQNPDGTLNDCLACDEELSGPVFKAVAGRTRRNTGLASAICRPCSEVRPIAHDYASVFE